MERLFDRHYNLIKGIDTSFVRYLHDEIDWSARMLAVVGARGVGKTTLLLQHIKNNNVLSETLFVDADNYYFTEHTLYDTAVEFHKNGGKHLYIDEIHKYSNWSQELKMIYDSLPKLQVVFTGSSILDIYKGSADLSRRVLTYHLAGLSFREYINITYKLNLPALSIDEIIAKGVSLPDEVEAPLVLFKQYTSGGYYPFFMEGNYLLRLQQTLNLTLEVDIPLYANMNVATSKKLRQLLYIIAQSVPFKPNFTKIGQMMDVHRNQVTDFMYYLEKAGAISQLRNQVKGINLLGKVDKVYLGNTNLIYLLGEEKPNIGNLRETAFMTMVGVRNSVFSSTEADFVVGKYTFEVGGKGKGKRQIENVAHGFVVKDDIEYRSLNVIPLWMFGFNY